MQSTQLVFWIMPVLISLVVNAPFCWLFYSCIKWCRKCSTNFSVRVFAVLTLIRHWNCFILNLIQPMECITMDFINWWSKSFCFSIMTHIFNDRHLLWVRLEVLNIFVKTTLLSQHSQVVKLHLYSMYRSLENCE